jgi:hypothetical protein
MTDIEISSLSFIFGSIIPRFKFDESSDIAEHCRRQRAHIASKRVGVKVE